jgi:hypothetical protein
MDNAIKYDDFWTDIPSEVQELIIKAKSELDQGEGIPHADIMAEIKVRFLNK